MWGQLPICRVALAASIAAGLLLGGCGPSTSVPNTAPAVSEAAATGAAATVTPDPLLSLSLVPGEMYFRLNGEPAFILSRNIAGLTPGEFEVLVEDAHKAGDMLVRVSVDSPAMGGHQGYGYTSDGAIIDKWSDKWEHFLDVAEANGVYVIPYFTGWMNWNTTGYNTWPDNPFNSANGGPAESPTEIFKADSPTQQLFIQWFKSVVERWQPHRNILAWELMSEVNLVGYISEPQGIYLVEQLAAAARQADPMHRPTTASLAETGNWHRFYESDAVEFINFHPYPPSGKLDTNLLTGTPRYLRAFGKPVLIGESGLSADLPTSDAGKLVVAPNADIGLRHSAWAALVSGSMNGRAWWWEDGYGVYFPELGLPWVQEHTHLEEPVVKFIQDVDMSGFEPVASLASSKLLGAAIGSERMIIGWYRDAACEPPDWPVHPVIAGQSVTLSVPGAATRWQVDFYDTKTGKPNGARAQVFVQDGSLVIPLSDFTDGIAVKAYPMQ